MAKDIFHNLVKAALQKDGWKITEDPFLILADEIKYEADLGAEILLGATKGSHKIVVEIKSFLQQSKIYEMHQALGQFITYSFALKIQDSERILYLAIPDHAYDDFFQLPFIQDLVKQYGLNLIVFSTQKPKIISWIKF